MEAYYEEESKWYPGRVDRLLRPSAFNELFARIKDGEGFAWNVTREQLVLNGMRKPALDEGKPAEESAKPPEPTLPYAIGEKCEAIYIDDGEWYKAEVVSVTMRSVKVKYTGYDGEASLRLDQVRAPTS